MIVTRASLLAVLTFVVQCFSFHIQPALAQPSSTLSTLDTQCTLVDNVSEELNNKLNNVIDQIDKIPNTLEMIQAHIELLRAAPDAVNYCDIERRLRRLSAKTYLLALPVEKMVDDAREFSLVYPQELFPTRSTIPRFAIWYERRGESVALDRLRDAGIDPRNNLTNLNFAGMLVEAEKHHERYAPPSVADAVPEDSKLTPLANDLNEYRKSGFLSNRHNVPLMYAASEYVRSVPDLHFTINSAVQSTNLSFFVIDSDPKRILVGYPCNCVYVPKTSIIICDKKLLDALEKWILYGRGDAGAPGILADVNTAISDLLLHWLIGHEIGHFINHDRFSTKFLAAFGTDTEEANTPPKPPKEMELGADRYAFEHFPSNLSGWGHMSVNFIIQQLVGIAVRSRSSLERSSTDPIVVHEDEFGHPNLLSRAFSLKKATGAVDFLLEAYEQRLTVSFSAGARLSSVCALSRAESEAR